MHGRRLMSIKLCASFFLLASVQCSFGQTDTNVLAIGEWSKPITDKDHCLRGRLLIYDDRVPSAANHARVYLELQHVFQGGWSNALAIYYDVGGENSGLHLVLCNGAGQPIPEEKDYVTRGPTPYPYWVILPCDSTLRLRVDTYTLGPETKPAGLEILIGGRCWIIPPRAKGGFFLSGSFTPPKHHSGLSDDYVWQGTLKLPKLKVPTDKL